MITQTEFDRVNKDYSYKFDGYPGIHFRMDLTGREVAEFLEKNGYNVVVHKAIGKIEYRKYDGGGGTESINYGHDYIERIIALKEGEIPPEKWDDYPSAIEIFSNVLKQKLLNL